MSSTQGESCGNSDGGLQKPERAPKLKKVWDPSKDEKAIKGRRNLPIDSETFIYNMNRQFKSNLTHNSQVRKFERIMIGLSGGRSSLAMLNMLDDAISKRSKRRMFFDVVVVHIDETGAFPDYYKNENDREQHLSKIKALMKEKYPTYEFHTFSLESLFGDSIEKLQSHLNSFKSLSGKEDIYNQLIKRALLEKAQELGINKVLTADNANNLASKVISNISKGRGFNIPLIIQYMDSHYSNAVDSKKFNIDAAKQVKTTEKDAKKKPQSNSTSLETVVFLRPMKDFLSKELSYYNHLMKLNQIFVPTFTTKLTLKTSSINRLCESFVEGLQADYPATVHTILRTAEKLKTPTSSNQLYCISCGSLLTDAETEEALETVKEHVEKNKIEKIEDVKLNKYEFAKLCCYGCKRAYSYKEGMINYIDEVTYKEVNEQLRKMSLMDEETSDSNQKDNQNFDVKDVPLFLQDNLKQTFKLSKEQMKNEIKDFLLDDEDDE